MNDETQQEATTTNRAEPTSTITESNQAVSGTPQQPGAIQLTEEQCRAVVLINRWFDTPIVPGNPATLEFKLGGYAGTGKTTIIRTIRDSLKVTIKVCAFTGKAVNVLQRKNIPAQTIHSLIYDATQDPQTKTWTFSLKYRLEARPELIIVDESSMLSTDLLRDLRSFKVKLLFVGDPGQLEPVGDNPNLMAEPNFILSKIHRQAESSPIILLASKVRTGVESCLVHSAGQQADGLVIRNKSITPAQILAASQLICARNKTRTDFNLACRRALQRPPCSLVIGEKIMVQRNNLSFGVFNGMILFVDELVKDLAEVWRVNCHDEVGEKYTELDVWKLPFQQPDLFLKKTAATPVPSRKVVYCDYAYAITCHKSQGSEWDKVIVYDEWLPPQVWDMARWRYTAITRAAKELTYLI